MKAISILIFLITTTKVLSAQDSARIQSLGKYFMGVPIEKNYEDWINYIDKTPGLGIDSIKKKVGIYSSAKENFTNRFPFPDFQKIIFLLQQFFYIDTIKNIITDSAFMVNIKTIFGSSNEQKKYGTCIIKVLLGK